LPRRIATIATTRLRLHRQSAAWSCRRPDLVPFTRRPSLLPRSPRQALEIRLPAPALCAVGPFSIAVPPVVPQAVPRPARAVTRNALRGRLPELPASSPAARAPSIPPAPVMPDRAEPAPRVPPARALDLALDPDLAVHLVPASARDLALAAHRPRVKHRVRSALLTSAPAAALHSIPRPRKAR